MTDAERWQAAGKQLRERSPELYEQTLVLLAAMLFPDDDEQPSVDSSCPRSVS